MGKHARYRGDHLNRTLRTAGKRHHESARRHLPGNGPRERGYPLLRSPGQEHVDDAGSRPRQKRRDGLRRHLCGWYVRETPCPIC